MAAEQRYLNQEDAARYLGYSPSYFARLVNEHQIPRRGAHGRRYDVRDLERFMEEPDYFLRITPMVHTRTGGRFTPVQA